MRYLLLVIVLLATGCQTNPFGEVPEHLGYRAEAFGDVVRWGALEKMYVFGKPDSDEPIKIPEGLRNVRVTGYELAQGLTEIKSLRWQQTAVIDYVLTDQQVVRQLFYHHFWVSDDGKIWYRENPPPQFR